MSFSSSFFGRALSQRGGENKEATSAAGPLCAKQDMRRVFSMKKVDSRSREKMVWSCFGLLSVVVRR